VASPVDNIKHMVVLMMENRSFDHMFGMMMDPDWAVDGLTGLESNPDSAENNILVTADADYSGEVTPIRGTISRMSTCRSSLITKVIARARR